MNLSNKDARRTDDRCPRASEHESEKNILLLERPDGTRFCALHGEMKGVMRFAVVAGARTQKEVKAYLPENYRIIQVVSEPNGVKVVIAGEDVAGWTLDDYVIPRLSSGLIRCKEYPDAHEARDAACAAMN